MITKEKRTQLILTAAVTLALLAAVYFTLIRPQQQKLGLLAEKRTTANKKLQDINDTKRSSAAIESELAQVSAQLATQERNMASGDEYVWLLSTIRQFKLAYKIEIPQYSTIVIGENSLIPKFPYKQATMTISGTAYYHELGRFISDLENRFPQMRVENVDIQQASTPAAGEFEKLTFKMDVVALIKSSH